MTIKLLFPLMTILALLALAPAACFGLVAHADSVITPAERQFADMHLNQTQVDFMQAVEGLTPAQLHFKPSADAWSIAECIEHIALTEQRLSERATESLRVPAEPNRRSEVKTTDQGVIDKMTDRSWKGNAPEAIQPGNDKFPNLEAATYAFMDQREQNINYVKYTKDDLRNHYMPHSAYGTLDTYQVFLLIAAHCKRHTLQIEAVKKTAGYPQ
jgi:hypothetical protein